MHVYIYTFGLTIPTYGLMITLGVILANVVGLVFINRKYPGECPEDFLIIEAYAFIGGFAGAKILYLIVSRNSIDWNRFSEASYFNQLMQGGFVFYGGLIGGLLVVFAAGRGLPFPHAAD